MERLGEDQREIRAHQHQDAVTEVDDVQHAEDQREADRGERVDTAQHEAVGEGLRDQVHGSAPLQRRIILRT